MSEPGCYTPDCAKCSLSDSCKNYQPVHPWWPQPYIPFTPAPGYYEPYPWPYLPLYGQGAGDVIFEVPITIS